MPDMRRASIVERTTIPITPIPAISAEGTSIFPHPGAQATDGQLAALEKHAAELQNTIAIETRSQANAKVEQQNLEANQHQLALIQTQIADLQNQQAQPVVTAASQAPAASPSGAAAEPESASDAQLAALAKQAAGLQIELQLMHSHIVELQEKSDRGGNAANNSADTNTQIATLEQQAAQLQKTIDIEISDGEDAKAEQQNLTADQRQLQIIQSRIEQLQETSNQSDTAASAPCCSHQRVGSPRRRAGNARFDRDRHRGVRHRMQLEMAAINAENSPMQASA
jgi:hypothetical protein